MLSLVTHEKGNVIVMEVLEVAHVDAMHELRINDHQLGYTATVDAHIILRILVRSGRGREG